MSLDNQIISKKCPRCGSVYDGSAALTHCSNDGAQLMGVLADPWLGLTLANRYSILEKAGAGGWGTVYLAEQLSLSRKVAVKVLDQKLSGDEQKLKRFEQEARTLSCLQHPGIVSVIDFGLMPQPYIVMEWVTGNDLAYYATAEKRLTDAQLLRIFKELAEALQHAHAAQVIHRDLKPSNVKVYHTGDREPRVKILDFGLAKIFQRVEDSITKTGECFGSPPYMSPEQCMGQPLAVTTDIYSLGCIMYEVLAGRPLFAKTSFGEYFMAHSSEVPQPIYSSPTPYQKRLQAVVFRCLAKKPQDRFQTAAQLLAELDQLGAAASGKAVPAPRQPAPAVAAIAAAVALALGLVAFGAVKIHDAPANTTAVVPVTTASPGTMTAPTTTTSPTTAVATITVPSTPEAAAKTSAIAAKKATEGGQAVARASVSAPGATKAAASVTAKKTQKKEEPGVSVSNANPAVTTAAPPPAAVVRAVAAVPVAPSSGQGDISEQSQESSDSSESRESKASKWMQNVNIYREVWRDEARNLDLPVWIFRAGKMTTGWQRPVVLYYGGISPLSEQEWLLRRIAIQGCFYVVAIDFAAMKIPAVKANDHDGKVRWNLDRHRDVVFAMNTIRSKLGGADPRFDMASRSLVIVAARNFGVPTMTACGAIPPTAAWERETPVQYLPRGVFFVSGSGFHPSQYPLYKKVAYPFFVVSLDEDRGSQRWEMVDPDIDEPVVFHRAASKLKFRAHFNEQSIEQLLLSAPNKPTKQQLALSAFVIEFIKACCGNTDELKKLCGDLPKNRMRDLGTFEALFPVRTASQPESNR